MGCVPSTEKGTATVRAKKLKGSNKLGHPNGSQTDSGSHCADLNRRNSIPETNIANHRHHWKSSTDGIPNNRLKHNDTNCQADMSPSRDTTSARRSSNKESRRAHNSVTAIPSTTERADATPDLNLESFNQTDYTYYQRSMKTCRICILLVFHKDDSQSDTFKSAAEKCGYDIHIARSFDKARSLYSEHQHDMVVIDCRHTAAKSFDSEFLCKSLKASNPKSSTQFLAVTKKCTDKEEPSVLPLLNAGFSRRFMECTSIMSCYNELISIEKCELRVRQQLQAFSALSEALQNISESVEVTDDQFCTEYVNSAFELQSGYKAQEVLGENIQDRLQVNNCNEEETLLYHLRKNQTWEGQQSLKCSNGNTILCKCRVVPLSSTGGKGQRHVIIRSPVSESSSHLDNHGFLPHWDYKLKDVDNNRTSDMMKYRRPSYLSLSSSIEGLLNAHKRRDSINKYHPLTIEAPINKVISLLYEARLDPNISVSVLKAIDTVLEILHTTELFVPQVQTVTEEDHDPVTSDYVGGLCDQVTQSSISRQSSHRHNSTVHRMDGSSKLQGFVPQPLSAEVELLLASEPCWTFDILALEKLTNKQTLVPLGLKIFHRFDACSLLGIDESVLANWLSTIADNYYQRNSYHNATHAADVLQATAYFLDKMRPKKIVTPMEEMAALIAAVIHDVDHPARTSSFLVNSRNRLALLYNDIAVLENHHAAKGFQLTSQNKNSNILKNLEIREYDNMRHNIIDMVLATEMAKHFEHLQKFIHFCKTYEAMKPMANEHDDFSSIKSGTNSNSHDKANENKRLVLRMAIKCADVSNPARPLPLCKEWAARISEEYFQQHEEEKSQELPVVMPNFGREICSIPHTQIKFIEVFLLNMFEQWETFLDIPDLEIVSYLQDNYIYWKDLDERGVLGVSDSSQSNQSD